MKWSNIETHGAEVAGEDFFVFLPDELEELHVLAQVLIVETSLQIFDERLDAEEEELVPHVQPELEVVLR